MIPSDLIVYTIVYLATDSTIEIKGNSLKSAYYSFGYGTLFPWGSREGYLTPPETLFTAAVELVRYPLLTTIQHLKAKLAQKRNSTAPQLPKTNEDRQP